MKPFQLERIGTIMEPEPSNKMEVEGVLNPAVTRGPDGDLYLFPRLVAKDNFSRIGIAKVKFNEVGDPVGVERLGMALEPEADYEKRPNGGGGCEDARVTFVDPLNEYIMTYTAFGPNGPRIAVARSKDLIKWKRLGLVKYSPYKGINFNGINNKDASIFPYTIISPKGHPSIGMLHRPLFPGSTPEETNKNKSRTIDSHKESIWISYYNFGEDIDFQYAKFTSNHRLAIPIEPWESLKIGAGAPPLLTKLGWLIVYHGVHALEGSTDAKPKLCYSAGVMILSVDDPQKVIYRSQKPILIPELPEETIGTIANVVFPTGIDCRSDIGQPNRIDVYYGMADNRIGVAKMEIPDVLPNFQ
ncbi:MAG: glycosidase [Pelobium sp.]